jgi:hypothetical protein
VSFLTTEDAEFSAEFAEKTTFVNSAENPTSSVVKTCLLLFATSLVFAACTSGPKTDANGLPLPTDLPGEQLAQQHCGSCHLFPEPGLLPKKNWEKGVLPAMRPRLGLDIERLYERVPYEELTELLKTGVYPDRPRLAEADFQKIREFYLKNAPDTLLPIPPAGPVKTGLPRFEAELLRMPVNRGAYVTKVLIEGAKRRLLVGDQSGRVRIFDEKLNRLDSLRAETAVSDLLPQTDGSVWALTMGIMPPNDLDQGGLVELSPKKSPKPLLQRLRRPVQVVKTDLNADGQPDALVCAYGNNLGQLAWYELGPGGPTKPHILADRPGARCAYVTDLNHDGRPDVVALMAQALESVSVFYNEGGGEFREEVLLSFPPVYGSSYLSLVDFDRDGDLDLLYTNGDNADYSVVPKPYHGVRLFLNDGQNHFKQAWFYPLDGVQQAEPRDFDGDGDLDLAVIAFFPDLKNQRAGFVYLQNEGSLRFTAHTFAGAEQGRWLTMDVGDLDGDGDDDLALGSYLRPNATPESLPAMPPNGLPEVVVLKNRGKLLRATAAR